MENFLKYGLLDLQLIHISEVANGFACGCICPNCKHPLIAKNNHSNIRTPHFAHYSGKECDGAIETALHLLAKEIFKKNKKLALPDYHFDYDHNNSASLFKNGKEINFDEVILEKQVVVDNEIIIPDAIGVINEKQVFIEFANTHFTGNYKIEKIKKLGIPCVEIDISKQLLDESSLTLFLGSNFSEKYWIINPRFDKEYSEYEQKELQRKKSEENEKKLEVDKKKVEARAKYNKFKNDTTVRLLLIKNGKITNCPKSKFALKQLKNSNHYKHSILKRIIDGEFWNCKIYGNNPHGKHIFLGNEKIIVYPADYDNSPISDQQKESNKSFWWGLMEIKDILENPTLGDCKNCVFSVDHFVFEENGYEVCKHPK